MGHWLAGEVQRRFQTTNQNDKLNKVNDESVAEISISERVTRWEKGLDLRSMKLPVTLASHQLSVAKDYLVKIISADHTSAPLYRKRYSIHTAVADMNIWVLRHDKVWIPILWDQVFLRQKFSFHPLSIISAWNFPTYCECATFQECRKKLYWKEKHQQSLFNSRWLSSSSSWWTARPGGSLEEIRQATVGRIV